MYSFVYLIIVVFIFIKLFKKNLKTFEMLCDDSSGSSLLFKSSSSSSNLTSISEEDMTINKAARIEDYTDVITRFTDLQFKQHFRLTRIVAGRVIGT